MDDQRQDDDRSRNGSDVGPSPWEATEGNKPLEAEMRGEDRGIFPPDLHPSVDVGGSPEERQVLEEEMNR